MIRYMCMYLSTTWYRRVLYEDVRVWRNGSLQASEWRPEHLLSPADLVAASARLSSRLSSRALRVAHVARDALSLGGFRFVTDI